MDAGGTQGGRALPSALVAAAGILRSGSGDKGPGRDTPGEGHRPSSREPAFGV